MSTQEKRTVIERLSEQVWITVRDMYAPTEHFSPPPPLGQLAKRFGVRRIRFEPLWSSAGLTRVEDGFEIVINTESPGVTQKETDVLETDSETAFELHPSLRFTIAHEVAHVLFLKAAGGRRGDVFVRHADAVENACNIVARILLLPKQLLLTEIKGRLLDLERMRSLIGAFRVSPEVFIRRMHLSDLRGEIKDQDGLILLAAEKDGLIVVEACHALGPRALDRFEGALRVGSDKPPITTAHASLSRSYRQTKFKLEKRPLRDLDLGIDVDTLLRAGKSGAKLLNVLWRPDGREVLPCNLVYHCLRDEPLTFLIAIKVIDELRLVGQESLGLESGAEPQAEAGS